METFLDTIPQEKGTYLLLVQVEDNPIIHATKKKWMFEKGIYAYIGSARNTGGLRARIGRHLKQDKKMYWHIDYLLANPNVEIIGTIFTTSKKNLECKVVKTLIKEGTGTPYAKRFGSSECKKGCPSHIIKLSTDTTPLKIKGILSTKFHQKTFFIAIF
ncbi:MAG: DUF123 domain-containing protein [Candidatus Wukongarchaeota archaeon]|nr:GIY-YIG nuclease family protein [Candidatus Wukongarchaeota archaeon]